MTSRTLAAIWIMSTLGIGAYLGVAINRDDKSVFLPGEMTSGHHQIGVACAQCHTPFGGVSQQACLDCHQDELHAAEDSHPERKFTDPRNADRAAKLDARKCVTCHTEHRPEITNVMAVTLPQDFCYQCHADIAEERPTHQGLTFDSCSSAGCHNFHDNRALYEDFLVRRGLEEPDVIVDGASPARHAFVSWEGSKRRPLTSADVARLAHYDEHAAASWAASAHAASGVSCMDCHESEGGWSEDPGYASCGRCHELESEGFLAGKHGMRLGVGLPAMSPANSRLPMQPDSLVKTLSCSSCHDAHAVNVRREAVDSCLSCHADDHSKAYRDSPHFRLWQSEDSGEGKPGSGVSCASCHMPREERTLPGGEHIVVQHNQNANLRPNEKMIREVCLHCHGLEFSIDALADRELIRQNFSGRPSRHIESIDMAVSRTR